MITCEFELVDFSTELRAPYLGQNGLRDPSSPCEYFLSGVPSGGRCEGDGHYLCRKCVRRKTCIECDRPTVDVSKFCEAHS